MADLAAAIRAAVVPQAVGDMEPIKNMLSERPRNQRVDLLKGIAIFFVIFFHCYYHSPDALLQPVRNVYLHIFFFIAGLFFSLKSGFPAFLKNKTERLLVPYAFFCILSAFVFLLCPWSWPTIYDSDMSPAGNLLTFFLRPTDEPVWFVMCLFWTCVFYYCCKRFFSSILLRGAVTLVLAVPAYFIAEHCYGIINIADGYGVVAKGFSKIFFGCHIPISLAMLPYVFLGDVAARGGILTLRLRGWRRTLPMIAAALLWIAASQTSDVSLFYYYLGNNVLLNNLASCAGIVFLWLAVQNVGRRVPLFSYLGRYSLVALGLHYIFFLLLASAGISGDMLCFVVVLILTRVSMPLVIRYFPRFVALKPLFRS